MYLHPCTCPIPPVAEEVWITTVSYLWTSLKCCPCLHFVQSVYVCCCCERNRAQSVAIYIYICIQTCLVKRMPLYKKNTKCFGYSLNQYQNGCIPYPVNLWWQNMRQPLSTTLLDGWLSGGIFRSVGKLFGPLWVKKWWHHRSYCDIKGSKIQL